MALEEPELDDCGNQCDSVKTRSSTGSEGTVNQQLMRCKCCCWSVLLLTSLSFSNLPPPCMWRRINSVLGEGINADVPDESELCRRADLIPRLSTLPITEMPTFAVVACWNEEIHASLTPRTPIAGDPSVGWILLGDILPYVLLQ